MECKLHDIISLGGKPGSGNLILGKVIQFHINESILTETEQVDPYKLDPIARNGGSWYTDAKKGLFELKKPNNIGIGFDQLPNYILNSNLTGNQLAKLASIESIPSFKDDMYTIDSKEDIIKLIKNKIDKNDIDDAWQLILYLGTL